MNYIEMLAPEESYALCDIVTGRGFVDFFKQNEQDFSRIKKGFRAKTLQADHALKIAKDNIKKPFIAKWVNAEVDSWLKKVQQELEQLEENGLTHSAALAAAIIDSPFADQVNLFFRVSGDKLEAESLFRIYENIGRLKSERATAERLKSIEEEKQELLYQIEVVKEDETKLREEHDQAIRKIEREKNKLKASLAEAQDAITSLQAPQPPVEENNLFAFYDDTCMIALPSTDDGEIVSLCEVFFGEDEQRRLFRHADLDCDGHYRAFRRDKSVPPIFNNRERLYCEDGPSNGGFYGIWAWSAVPSVNNPSSDYVSSRFSKDIEAIEVIVVSGAKSQEDLIGLLKSGIEYRPCSQKVMFSFCSTRGKYVGALCKVEEQLDIAAGKARFAKNCSEVPVYEFTEADILRLSNGLSFYGRAFAGLPQDLFRLRDPRDIVKDIVLSSVTWSICKARGLSRADHKVIKEFLSKVPVDGITERIEAECHCSGSEAKKLLRSFLDIAGGYIDGSSLEDEVILSVIAANPELQEKMKGLLRADWETENKDLVGGAQEQLNAVKSELSIAQTALDEARLEKENLDKVLADKEKLAEDVELAVSERIRKARDSAADFIADMAFAGGRPAEIKDSMVFSEVGFSRPTVLSSYCVTPALLDENNLEAHHSWADVVETAELELCGAGVAERCRRGLAAFLCAAYIRKQPILLVGPNAIDILQSFSAAVASGKLGVLRCDGAFSYEAIAEIGASGEDIVAIHNLIASGWMNRLPEVISNKDIFYVATHPYAEDVQVEPKSLYGFMLPIFTDFFVDRGASGGYCGGYFAKDFEPYSEPKGSRGKTDAISKLMLSPLVEGRISDLIYTMHNICPSATTDDDFLFGVLPICYAELTVDNLMEVMEGPQADIAVSSNLKRNLRHVLGTPNG